MICNVTNPTSGQTMEAIFTYTVAILTYTVAILDFNNLFWWVEFNLYT